MLKAWRLAKARHARAAFDGEGARLHGGRWNSPGTSVAYASATISLATLEVLAHLQSTTILQSYALAAIVFPVSEMEVLDLASLPKGWRRFPTDPANQAIGDRWVREGRSLVLQVPSAIIPSESNFLINPLHGAFGRAIIEPPKPFMFDQRLSKS